MIDARSFCDAAACIAKAREVRARLFAATLACGDGAALVAAAAEEADLRIADFSRPFIFDVGVAGALDRVDGILYVDAALTPSQRTWVLAHELGHLHLDSCSMPLRRCLPEGTARIALEGYSPDERSEVEADLFAAEFLLPADDLRRAHGEISTMEDIAGRLGIPVEVVVAQSIRTFLGVGSDLAAARVDRRPALRGAAALASATAILVTGPPGSGKTALAAREIASLVSRGIPARSIALCSRTEAMTALAMDRVPSASAAGVWSGTLAGLAQEILRQHPRAGLDPSRCALDDVGAMSLIADNAHVFPTAAPVDPSIGRFRPARLYRTIAMAKTGTSPRPPLQGAAELVEAFDRLVAAHGGVASPDLARSCVALLGGNGEVLRHVAARWRYLVVDDAEEASAAEGALIGLLVRAGTRVMALSAPGHTAFRFKGADPEAFARMAAEAGFTTMDVREATASTDGIGIAAGTNDPVQVRRVQLSRPDDLEDEARTVRSTAERWRASGIALEGQVVLARRHATLAGIAARLSAGGIAVERTGDLLGSDAVLDLLAVARLAEDGDGDAFRRVAAFGVYALRRSTTEALLRLRGPGEASLGLLSRPGDWHGRGIAAEDRGKLGRMAADFLRVGPEEGPWRIVTAWLFGSSGYLRTREDDIGPVHAAVERRAIRDFLGVCEEQDRMGDKSAVNLEARLKRLRSRLQETNQSRDPRRPLAGALRLMTIHEAKGRNFEAVHLVGLSAWRRPRTDAEERAESALFEIAVSRASHFLHISHMAAGAQDRAPRFVTDFERAHRRAPRGGVRGRDPERAISAATV